ncbi:MAG: winged helix-turn-helix domain-containing protein [Thiothrix sp.]|nr:winged helix-turn-helix domain-containing protein [Thiothrix sp.]
MTKKTSVTGSIRAGSLLIIATILGFGYQSIRQLAEQCHLSKSAVHRHLQAHKRRNRHSMSYFWETEAGSAFLQRLVYACLYLFGLKNQVGAETLSEFFRLIRIDSPVGVSASALRQKMRELEKHLAGFQPVQEGTARCPEPARTVAMDETFFSQMMVLILMDLPSGYIMLEEAAGDRCYETWKARACTRLETLGLTVRHAVSDRAKALVKLAVQGFHCQAGADLFHAQYELSRWLALPLGRTTQTMAESLGKVRTQQAKHLKKSLRAPQETRRLEGVVKQAGRAHQDCLDAQAAYRQHQQAISEIVHPFDPTTGLAQDQATVLTALQAEADAIQVLAEARLIPDPKGRLEKFRKQLDDLSQPVGGWWLWVHALLADCAPDPVLKDWVVNRMMPVVYWHERLT